MNTGQGESRELEFQYSVAWSVTDCHNSQHWSISSSISKKENWQLLLNELHLLQKAQVFLNNFMHRAIYYKVPIHHGKFRQCTTLERYSVDMYIHDLWSTGMQEMHFLARFLVTSILLQNQVTKICAIYNFKQSWSHHYLREILRLQWSRH